MSEKDKDNKNIDENRDFEFIKEQVIEKKRRKLRKRLQPVLITSFLAIIFGLIASLTFVIAEPKLYKWLHKEEEIKTPITFPTQSPIHPDDETTEDDESTEANNTPTQGPKHEIEVDNTIPDPVIQKIPATIEDLLGITDEVRDIAYEANKSQVYITSTFTKIDLFGNEVEKTIETSGVIVANNNSDFLILVSLDNVKDANSIKIKFSDISYVDVTIQDYESDLNLAILALAIKDVPKINMNELQVAVPGESYTLTVGAPVIALGNPNGHNGSMDIGIITSKGSWADVIDNRIELFNTNMDCNAYSDGIIVNMKGQMIGLITRTLKNDVNEELCTAIGISEILPIIEQMSNQEARIYFGIKADDMTANAKQEHEVENGIFVSEVQAESPAFEAGMKNGDVILSVNEQTIVSTNDFYSTVSSFKAGDKITVKIKRTTGSTEREIDLTVVLTEKVQ